MTARPQRSSQADWRTTLTSQTPTALVVYAFAITAAASGAAFVARLPCCQRLEHAMFYRLFAFDDTYNAAFALLLCALVAVVPPLRRLGAVLAEDCARAPRWVAIGAFVALAIGAHVVYLGHAFSMDEYAPRFQAHVFAIGQVAAHWPVELIDRIVVPGFRGAFLFVDPVTGLTTSTYWPGLAVLLAPLAAFDLEWLLNPALSALALLMMFRLATDLAGDARAGGWAMLFALASPAFTVNAISFYAMPGLLLFDLVFAWLLIQGSVRAAALAGLIGGLALTLHNPVPHAAFALPWLVWLALDRARWPRLAAVLAGYLPCGLGFGLGWPLLVKALGVDPGVTTHASGGFVAGWLDRLHYVFRLPSADLVRARLAATWKLWIWAFPGLWILFGMAQTRSRAMPWLRLLSLSLLITYLFYFLVAFDQGHGWGYRYMHSAWGVVPVVAGVYAASRLGESQGPAWREWMGALAVVGLLATPFFFWQVRANIAENLAGKIAVPAQGYWVVFVAPTPGLYSLDLVQNFPGRGRVLTLWTAGDEQDEALMARLYGDARRVILDARGSAWQLSRPPLPLQSPER